MSADVSRIDGPLTSNSLYSSRNLGGLILPMRTSPPTTGDSRLIMPSGSKKSVVLFASVSAGSRFGNSEFVF